MSFLKRLLGQKPAEELKLQPEIGLKPSSLPNTEEKTFEFEDEQKESEIEEFMEIGGSPVPGLTLRHILRGHKVHIGRISWSSDGRLLASGSGDEIIHLWDALNGDFIKPLRIPTLRITQLVLMFLSHGRQMGG